MHRTAAEAATTAAVQAIADDFAAERIERLQRTELHRADFERLADAGFLLTGVPQEQGGLWQNLQTSSGYYAELVRTLAAADPAVALVASMHPSITVFWADNDDSSASASHADGWRQQRQWVFEQLKAGHWFGTIASEPGSGGDLMATRSIAAVGDDGHYYLSGDKHMGSGSGVTSYMMTTAIAGNETEPEMFLLDMRHYRDAPWDSDPSLVLTRPWRAYGMAATQSHAFRFDAYPTERSARPGEAMALVPTMIVLANCLFSAVTMGLIDAAVAEARRLLRPRGQNQPTRSAFEQLEWTRVENDYWLAQQAFAGLLRSTAESEHNTDALMPSYRAKVVLAELTEALMQRLCRVVGGASLARALPFGQWSQDVRALGFLRPPWPLAYDKLIAAAWPPETLQ